MKNTSMGAATSVIIVISLHVECGGILYGSIRVSNIVDYFY